MNIFAREKPAAASELGSENLAARGSPRRARPLVGGDFRCVAQNGFGDGNNSYAYSSAWFNDHLYIGSNRHILPLLILRLPFEANFAKPPTPTPPDHTSLDLRAQIWRYSPATGVWERVYHAPLVPGFGGRQVPQAFGFRGMAVFQGKGESKPSIYTLPFVGRNVLESVTFRSSDGINFETVPAPQIKGLPTIFGSFRSMVPFKGRLFVAPSSSKPDPKAQKVVDGKEIHVTLANTSRQTAVLCTDDPISGEWRLSSEMLFGDRTNTNVMDMTPCGDYLYTGATNALNGFQLWRTRGEGPPPHHWEKVLERGAERGALNQVALSMAEFKGSLYIGTCVQNGGYDQHYNIGPAASELVRFHPDGSWDLVVGDPRMTSQGFKTPTSGMRPGFNNPLACYFWRMCVHEDALYVGTCDVSSFVPFSNIKTWPEHAQRLLRAESLERFMEYLGGCELWRSTDGDNWTPMTRNGFNNRFNLGVRSLVSTPHGLFVGTANPFGSHVAVQTESGWRYEENPRGGVEVWLGANNHKPLAAASSPAKPALNATESRVKKDYWRSESSPTYVLQERSGAGFSGANNPMMSLTSVSSQSVGVVGSVAEEMDAYFGGPARNVGYWRSPQSAPNAACRELVRQLLEMAPAGFLDRESLIVGLVGSAASSLDENIRESLRGASCKTIEVDQVSRIGAESCDLLIAIESPAIGDKTTLAKLKRILKPGGVLLAAHGISADNRAVIDSASVAQPDAANRLENLRAQFTRAGFTNVRAEDITAKSWTPFFNHSRNYWLSKLLFKQLDAATHGAILASLPGGKAGWHSYVLICALIA